MSDNNFEAIKDESKRINGLIEEGTDEALGLALTLCENPAYADNMPIQSQRVTILIKFNRLDEALSICEKNPDHVALHSQKITILSLQRRRSEALDLCDDPRFVDNPQIVCQKITLLAKEHKIEEALSLSEDPRLADNLNIASERIGILIRTRNYNRAIILCNNPAYCEFLPIVSQKVTILIALNLLDVALKICENPKYAEYLPIVSQRITILVMLGRIDEALTLCDAPENRNYPPILSQKIAILKDCECYNEALDLCYSASIYDPVFKTQIVSILMSIIDKICNDGILDEEDIPAFGAKGWQQVILMAAFYEQNKYPQNMVIKYFQRQQALYQNNDTMQAILSTLIARAKSKTRALDKNVYKKLLSTEMVEPNITSEKEHLINIANSFDINPNGELKK
ncbi:MAG: hypothetical protein K2J20_04645 [Bacilli bacterium]|nr:hypothetical protein [Bacilli bacterium]